MKKVIISCGGTGGHIYPGIAIGQVLRSKVKDISILYVGTETGMEKGLITKEKFEFLGISSGKILRKLSFTNVLNFFKFIKGIFQSMKIIKTFKPELVIGLGSYVCAPVAVAGWLKKVPVVLHEQNAIPGLTNKALSRIAKKILASFEESIKLFPKGKAVFTGKLVREDIGRLDRDGCIKKLNLDASKKTISVIGGSQGSHRMNTVFFDTLKYLKSMNVQVLWMTGQKDFETYKSKTGEYGSTVLVQPFFHNINELYAVTDLIVCRAGASTIAEIIKCGIPAIFVPYPFAAHNHQFYNADELVKNNAALMIDEKELTAEALQSMIKELVRDESRLKALSKNMKSMDKVDSREAIFKVLTELV